MACLMVGSSGRLAARDSVLLIRLGAVGDILRTLPALHLIRKAYPSARLAWIVEELSLSLLAGHPEIDRVIPFPRRDLQAEQGRPWRQLRRLAALRRELREIGFDASLDFQGSFKSGLVALLSGAPRRIGFAPGHGRELSYFFANEWVRPPSRRIHRVEKNLLLAEAIGASDDEVTIILPERPEGAAEAESILRRVAPCGEPVVVPSPGTSHRQAYKRWPAGHYGRLAGLLRGSLGAAPLVVWGPGEEDLARGVVAESRGAAILAPALGLRPLAALLRRAGLFVGADTGPMHLAWGVGCPVVALFGPTDPRLNAPLGEGHAILLGSSTTDAIPPERVLAAVRAILEKRAPRGSPAMRPVLSRGALLPGEVSPRP